eukprot:4523042-Pyramimonas_sp.AAC.1
MQRDAKASLGDMLELCRRGGISEDHLPKDVRMIAGVGSAGRYPNNCYRDLEVLLGSPLIPLPSQTR